MFYCCRNLTDVCLLKQGGSRYPPPPRPGRNLENNTQSRPYSTHTAPMRFSGSSLFLSCLTVSFSCGIVYSRVKRTLESEKKKTYVYLIKRKIKKKMLVYVLYVPCTYISPFVLALEGGVNSNPSSRERLFLRMANPRQTGPKQLRTWLTRSVLPHTGDQARSVE